MLSRVTIKKVLYAKTSFIIAISLLCWFGLNAIIDFSNMPALKDRNLDHYYIYRHITALFIGLGIFIFTVRYGVHFNNYYPYFLGLAALLVVLPFIHGSPQINGFRRWFECGGLQIRVGPAILLLLLPALCVFCDRVEKNIDIRKNMPCVALIVIVSNICFFILCDAPILLLSDIIFVLIIMSCKIHPSIKIGFLGYVMLSCFILIHTEFSRIVYHVALTVDSINQSLQTGSLDKIIYCMGFQSHLAFKDIASGGLFGAGYGGYSAVNKWIYPLPTISSFIFQIIGKEYGISGLLLNVLLFSYLFYFLTVYRKKMDRNVNEKIVYAMTLFVILPAFLGFFKTFSLIAYFPSYQIPFLGYGTDWLILYFLASGTALAHINKIKYFESVPLDINEKMVLHN